MSPEWSSQLENNLSKDEEELTRLNQWNIGHLSTT